MNDKNTKNTKNATTIQNNKAHLTPNYNPNGENKDGIIIFPTEILEYTKKVRWYYDGDAYCMLKIEDEFLKYRLIGYLKLITGGSVKVITEYGNFFTEYFVRLS